MCVISVLFSYIYISQQNRLVAKRIAIETLESEIHRLMNCKSKYQYELRHFENPAYLMNLIAKKEFMHLEAPKMTEVLALHPPKDVEKPIRQSNSVQTLLGAKFPQK